FYLLYTFVYSFFFFNAPASTQIYTLSLHDALPISSRVRCRVESVKTSREPRAARYRCLRRPDDLCRRRKDMMRKLTYYVAATIDGFIATEDGSVDFFPVGGDHSQAITAQYPETLPTKVRESLGIAKRNSSFDTVLMGRKTHDFGVRTGTSSPYEHLRQYVVSTTLTESPGVGVELISEDPLGRVRELKKEQGLGIWLCGGGELAQTL